VDLIRSTARTPDADTVRSIRKIVEVVRSLAVNGNPLVFAMNALD
jgi:hypothetical protein